MRGEIENMSDEEFKHTAMVFAINYKASKDLIDMFEQRIWRYPEAFGK